MNNNLKCVKVREEFFHGAISFEYGDGTIRPWRLEVDKRNLYVDETLLSKGKFSAGVRLRVRTDSKHLGLEIAAVSDCQDQDAKRQYDLVVHNELIETKEIGQNSNDKVIFELPESDDENFEIWLSQASPTNVKCILIDEEAELEAVIDRRPRWITYGSSITQCVAAYSPTRTWPGLVARMRNLNLTCLGYGGQCHLDPLIAMMIRDQQADIISLKLGINVQGSNSLSLRTFASAVIGFVRIIREKQPNVPILLISPICSPCRETERNAVELSLIDMRQIIADCTNRLEQAGDKHVYYFSGLDLLGDSNVELLTDGCHPNGQGYELMGQHFVEKIFDPIVKKYPCIGSSG
jgi:hypothetical protein